MIIVDNQLIEDSIISSLGFNFGYGCFETIYFNKGNIEYLKEHIKRISSSAKVLNLKFDSSEMDIKKNIIYLVNKYKEKNNIKENQFAIKLNLVKGLNKDNLIYSIRKYNYFSDNEMKITFSTIKKNPYSKLIYHKTNNYLENYLEKEKANKLGYDECIFTNIFGEITEGSYTNIFFVKNQTVFTPKLESGLLNGIIRQKLIEELIKSDINIIEGSFKKDDLLKSDEIFLTNSLMKIKRVNLLDNKSFNKKNSIIDNLIRDIII